MVKFGVAFALASHPVDIFGFKNSLGCSLEIFTVNKQVSSNTLIVQRDIILVSE
jgi:hypothetical protein